MTKSLFFRLMGAFALVIVVGYSIVYFIANQATANEFHFYLFRGQMVATQDVANQLADYYRARKSWDGVESILLRDTTSSTGMTLAPHPFGSAGVGGDMMNSAMMGTPHLWLADARGIIIAATDNSRRGQQAIASCKNRSATSPSTPAQDILV